MRVYVTDREPTGVAWRTRHAWPCSIVEGVLEHEGRAYTITRQPLAGPRWAIGVPDRLPAKALLAHGVEDVATIRKAAPGKKPAAIAASVEAVALEETATELVVQAKKDKTGKVTETREAKPAPTPIGIAEPLEVGEAEALEVP